MYVWEGEKNADGGDFFILFVQSLGKSQRKGRQAQALSGCSNARKVTIINYEEEEIGEFGPLRSVFGFLGSKIAFLGASKPY